MADEKVIKYVVKGNALLKGMRTDVIDPFGRVWYHRSRSVTFGSVEDRMKNEEGVVLWEMHKPMLGWDVTVKSQVFNSSITLHNYGIFKVGYDFQLQGQRFKIKKIGYIGEDFHLIHATSLEPLLYFNWAYMSMSKRGDMNLFPEAMSKYSIEESLLIAIALVYLDILEDRRNS